jgi:hypothetical protein
MTTGFYFSPYIRLSMSGGIEGPGPDDGNLSQGGMQLNFHDHMSNCASYLRGTTKEQLNGKQVDRAAAVRRLCGL